MENAPKHVGELMIHIENSAGTYKSFEIEGDPLWQDYPLKGVTYPVNYGYIEGYEGEDGAELDIFVGTGDINGFIKMSRKDVPVETKFFKNLTQEELKEVLEAFEPVLLSHHIIPDQESFLKEIETFKK